MHAQACAQASQEEGVAVGGMPEALMQAILSHEKRSGLGVRHVLVGAAT